MFFRSNIFCFFLLFFHFKLFADTKNEFEQGLQEKLEGIQEKIEVTEEVKELIKLHEKAYDINLLIGRKNKQTANHLIKAACLLKQETFEKDSFLKIKLAEVDRAKARLDDLLDQHKRQEFSVSAEDLKKARKKFNALDSFYNKNYAKQDIFIEKQKKKVASFLFHAAECCLEVKDYDAYTTYIRAAADMYEKIFDFSCAGEINFRAAEVLKKNKIFDEAVGFFKHAKFCYEASAQYFFLEKSLKEVIQLELFLCQTPNLLSLGKTYEAKALNFYKSFISEPLSLARIFFFRSALVYLAANNIEKAKEIYGSYFLNDTHIHGVSLGKILNCYEKEDIVSLKEALRFYQKIVILDKELKKIFQLLLSSLGKKFNL